MENRLIITRLAPFTNKKHILKAFETFKPTKAVVRIGRSGNTCFLTFANREDAQVALSYAQRHPITLKGRQLRVMLCDPWNERGTRLGTPSTSKGNIPFDDPLPGYNLKYAPELPENVVARIASYLPYEDRCRMELVNRTWRRGTLQSMREVTTIHVDDWRYKQGWSTRLITKHSFYWTVTRAGSQLKHIILNRDIDITPHVISFAARCCPNLEHLDITGVIVRPTMYREMELNLKKLRILRVGKCLGPVIPHMSGILRNNPQLEVLEARETYMGGDIMGHLPTELAELILHNNYLFPEMTKIGLLKQHKLRTLAIRGSKQFSFAIMEALQQATLIKNTLHHLELENCNVQLPRRESSEPTEENERGLDPYYELPVGTAPSTKSLPENFKFLNTLIVGYSGWVDNEFVEEMGRNLFCLEHLDISSCTNIRGQFALDSLGNLTRLRILKMNLMYTDVGGHFLSELNFLEHLECMDSLGVYDEDLCGLIINCESIRFIDAEGCVNVSDRLITSIKNKLRGKTHRSLTMYLGGTPAGRHVKKVKLFNVKLFAYRHSANPFE